MRRRQKIKKGSSSQVVPDIWEPRINRFSCCKTVTLAITIIAIVIVLIGCANITVPMYIY